MAADFFQKRSDVSAMVEWYYCELDTNHERICEIAWPGKKIITLQRRCEMTKNISYNSFLIWNRHGHECSRIWKLSGNFTLIQCIKKCRDFLGRDISGTTFFRAESSVIQSSLVLVTPRIFCRGVTSTRLHSIELSFLTKSQKLTSA
jgi:hypothetical protein